MQEVGIPGGRLGYYKRQKIHVQVDIANVVQPPRLLNICNPFLVGDSLGIFCNLVRSNCVFVEIGPNVFLVLF